MFMRCKKALSFALLALSPGVFAQQPPTAGSQLQQIPATPLAPKALPEFRIQPSQSVDTSRSEQTKLLVKKIRVTGAQAYSEAELIAVAEFPPEGGELPFSELRAMAARITSHYRSHGYFVAEAYLPAQDIADNVVTIAVREGQYGKVVLRNQSRLSTPVAQAVLAGLNSGDVIATGPLERRLLQLSDLPGVAVSATLAPGDYPASSDLIVDIAPGPWVAGSVDADNAGNRYTGAYRLSSTLNLNNPSGRGDVASLRVVTSGSGLNYVRAAYQMPFGRAMAGAAYSQLRYGLGQEFKALEAHGTAENASLFGGYALIRARDTNLTVRITYDDKTFQDRIDSNFSVVDKKSRAWTAGLSGDYRDSMGGGGYNTYGLNVSSGNVDIRTPAALSGDATTAKSNGSFAKLGFNASRLQNIAGPFSVFASVYGQLASKNLDVSEKMELGGLNGIRAYPEGEAYADQGYVLSLEGRVQLPKFSQQIPGQMQLIGFVDAGAVTQHKNPWVAGENARTLRGAGVGFSWADSNNFYLRTYYARKLGNEPATSAPDRSDRFWIQAAKFF